MYKSSLFSPSRWLILISCWTWGVLLWSDSAIYIIKCSGGNQDDVWRVDNLIQFIPSNPLDELGDIIGTLDGHRHITRTSRNEAWCYYIFYVIFFRFLCTLNGFFVSGTEGSLEYYDALFFTRAICSPNSYLDFAIAIYMPFWYEVWREELVNQGQCTVPYSSDLMSWAIWILYPDTKPTIITFYMQL